MTQRILVIEDQEDNRIILRDLLTSADFEVIEALNGQEGVDMAEAEKPDLDAAAMHFDDSLGDCEPQPGAALLLGG